MTLCRSEGTAHPLGPQVFSFMAVVVKSQILNATEVEPPPTGSKGKVRAEGWRPALCFLPRSSTSLTSRNDLPKKGQKLSAVCIDPDCG